MVNNAQKAAVLEEVIDHISKMHHDVRAEVVVGELLDNHIKAEEIAVQNENVFVRAFNKDILDAKLDDSQPYHPFISLTLSRDGLYDRLPEGIFHQFTPTQDQRSVRDMVQNYKRQQKEQQEARKFFRPIENEFFLQRVFLEQKEKHLLFEAFGKNADELFLNFWGIRPDLPSAALKRLVKLLPYIYRVAGNLPLVQLYLQAILEEPVKLTQTQARMPVQTGDQVSLGESRLGMDMMTGDTFYSDMPVIKITVGPLKNHKVYDFLAWKPYGLLLETCIGFLLPADVDVETDILPGADEKKVAVADKKVKEGLPGYNFYI